MDLLVKLADSEDGEDLKTGGGETLFFHNGIQTLGVIRPHPVTGEKVFCTLPGSLNRETMARDAEDKEKTSGKNALKGDSEHTDKSLLDINMTEPLQLAKMLLSLRTGGYHLSEECEEVVAWYEEHERKAAAEHEEVDWFLTSKEAAALHKHRTTLMNVCAKLSSIQWNGRRRLTAIESKLLDWAEKEIKRNRSEGRSTSVKSKTQKAVQRPSNFPPDSTAPDTDSLESSSDSSDGIFSEHETSGDDVAPAPKKSKLETFWTNDYLDVFLDVVLDPNFLRKLKDRTTKKGALWTQAASTLKDMGIRFGDVSDSKAGTLCNTKFTNIGSLYRKILLRKTGTGGRSKPFWFDRWDAAFGKNQINRPQFVIEPSSPNFPPTFLKEKLLGVKMKNAETEKPSTSKAKPTEKESVSKNVRPPKPTHGKPLGPSNKASKLVGQSSPDFASAYMKEKLLARKNTADIHEPSTSKEKNLKEESLLDSPAIHTSMKKSVRPQKSTQGEILDYLRSTSENNAAIEAKKLEMFSAFVNNEKQFQKDLLEALRKKP